MPQPAIAENPELTTHVTGMFSSIGRFRDATRALRMTMDNVTSKAGAALKESPAIANEWQDLRFIVETTVDGLERGWRDNAKKDVVPTQTAMYTVAGAISWDLRNAHTIGGEPFTKELIRRVQSSDPWPIEIFYETPCKNLTATYKLTQVPGVEGRVPVSAYEKRSPMTGTHDYTYPGFALHLSYKKAGLYYQHQLPFGKILDRIRELTSNGALPPRMGTVYQAAIVYCFYEIFNATQEYHTHLRNYQEVAGTPLVEGPTSPFAFLDLPVVEGSKYTWYTILSRAHVEAAAVCGDYYAGVEKTRPADILGGNLDASELARDPTKIGGILENVLGIRGINADMLKNIPGFSAITDAISGALGTSNPK